MSLPNFELHQPSTIEEACALLEKHSGGIALLAGGTDLLVNIRRKIIPEHLPRCRGCGPVTGEAVGQPAAPPAHILALSRIPGLSGINQSERGIDIGPLTTITEIAESPLARMKLTALAEGAMNLGSPLVRNRGTIGGNICSARPAGDALIPATALRAELELTSSRGTRTVLLEEFVTGPGETVLQPGEILTNIVFPELPANSGSACLKLANRKALEIAVVNVAAVVTMDEERKLVASARICLGAVGPRPIMAVKAAEFLQGKAPSGENFTRAGEIASGEARPITDHRGGAVYRLEMVKTLVKRALSRIVN